MTILFQSTQNIVTTYGTIMIACGLIGLIIGLVIALYEACDEFIKIAVIICCISVISLLAGLTIGAKPHEKIKVILSDNYPAIKLYEKYNIEGREGNIWTLISKKTIEEEEKEMVKEYIMRFKIDEDNHWYDMTRVEELVRCKECGYR